MKLTTTEKKLQSHVIRFLMVDNQQITFNKITETLEQRLNGVQGKLLDDQKSFEKMLNLQWDVIIFHAAYDFNFEQALSIIYGKNKKIPVILLSDMNSKSSEALKILKLGIYDIIDHTHLDHLTLSLYRASIYSRLVRRELQLNLEIDQLQQQTQNLVETTEHAVAIFQEGVHLSVNSQYAKLFGADDPEEFIGLPILDILQPQDTLEFKQFFKKLSKGDLNQPTLKIVSRNPHLKDHTLSLQFSNVEFENEPALQLIIATANDLSETKTGQQGSGFASIQDVYDLFNFAFIQHSKLAVILYIVDQLPQQVIAQTWNSSRAYFAELEKNLALLTENEFLRLSETVFLTTQAVNDQATLAQNLKKLSVQLPTQLNILQQTYPVNVHLSAQLLDHLPQENEITALLQQTFRQSFDPKAVILETKLTSSPEAVPEKIQINFGAPITEHVTPEPTLSYNVPSDATQKALSEQIDQNTIQLSFQQLYDKEDIDTHIYEVTASFQYENKAVALETFAGLAANPELAIKADRWVLVEASKRLHQFLTTCPKSRIVVNLHAISLSDPNLIPLLSKLVNLINSKYTRPLILQFEEQDILANITGTAKFIQAIQDYNIGIAVANFGQSIYCVNILQQLKISFAKLAPEFTAQLLHDDSLVELQEKLDSFKQYDHDVKFLISELNDMTLFANAWNIDVRYLQGDYFQAKQNHFLDSAG
ncbi:MAG: EAL domain-containing protein [Acinetobacter populi]|jgi:EAL domain-containing protein (putative c-di-GMP-specific phosphodiesterase class I)/PAS domain-containing protein|uniref:EAL domain-containing protein n=1 Tax=Acinetobacter populi TaxID=1582270 RepID=UPI0023558EEB|nr:EAL domain-containing protein [Acinetobacter populi]MCH4247267.1 EAL domain-containing protein [Acinetobacter populi]